MSERWPALMTIDEAANYLGVGVTTIKQLRASEQIRSVRVREKIIRYRRVDLDKFIEELPEGIGEFDTVGTSKRKA